MARFIEKEGDPPRTLGIGLWEGPKGVRFFVSEVTLYMNVQRSRCGLVLKAHRLLHVRQSRPDSGLDFQAEVGARRRRDES